MTPLTLNNRALNDHACLVIQDSPHTTHMGLKTFADRMREEYPDLSTQLLAQLFGRYMGFDGRILPTHDYQTGLPL